MRRTDVPPPVVDAPIDVGEPAFAPDPASCGPDPTLLEAPPDEPAPDEPDWPTPGCSAPTCCDSPAAEPAEPGNVVFAHPAASAQTASDPTVIVLRRNRELMLANLFLLIDIRLARSEMGSPRCPVTTGLLAIEPVGL